MTPITGAVELGLRLSCEPELPTGNRAVQEGVSDSNKVWLRIKVDGQDGWVSGEEDFEAVGLPQAG